MAATEVEFVAKRKSKKVETSKPGEAKPVLTLRAIPEWHEWLKELAESEGVGLTTVIDLALRDYAKNRGFKKSMPRRF